ncbi:MAG TPA: F0F1 ATP synthase subunit delta, partial [Steroidobacteraceae bacterium]|nr:F0F1 ATP synthase subunit delta [Steroidobacteraceae bacterium]
MADRLTIARPYARAAFAEARQNGGLAPWSQALQAAALVVRDSRVARLLDNPRVTPEELAQLVDEIAAVPLGERGANFVRILADNHRLGY